jgi:hypothetical protein
MQVRELGVWALCQALSSIISFMALLFFTLVWEVKPFTSNHTKSGWKLPPFQGLPCQCEGFPGVYQTPAVGSSEVSAGGAPDPGLIIQAGLRGRAEDWTQQALASGHDCQSWYSAHQSHATYPCLISPPWPPSPWLQRTLGGWLRAPWQKFVR